MAGIDPAIHVEPWVILFRAFITLRDVDGRVEPGHDAEESVAIDD
jgi:hypothetical protein